MKQIWLSMAFIGCLVTGCKSDPTSESSAVSVYVSSVSQSETSAADASGLHPGAVPSVSSETGKSNETVSTDDIDWDAYDRIMWAYDDFVKIDAAAQQGINARLVALGSDTIIDFYCGRMGDDYAEAIEDFINEDKAPDIITAGIGYEGTDMGTMRAYSRGWLMELDEYLSSDAGRALYDSVPEAVWKSGSCNGSVYGVSTIPIYTYRIMMYVNTEIAQKLGVSLDELQQCCSIEDLEPILAAASKKSEDVDLLVVQEMGGIPMSVFLPEADFLEEPRNITSQAIVTFDTPNAKAENLFATDLARKRFETVREYTQKGYMTTTNNRKGDFLIFLSEDTEGSPKDALADMIRPLYRKTKEVKAVPLAVTYLPTSMNSVTGVCAKSHKAEKALKVLEYVMTDAELSNYLIHGSMGQRTYQDGRVTSLTFMLHVQYFPNYLIADPLWFEEDKEGYYRECFQTIKTSPFTGLYLDLRPYTAEITACNGVIGDYMFGLMRGEYENVGQTLDELNQKLSGAGIDKVLQYINDKITENAS